MHTEAPMSLKPNAVIVPDEIEPNAVIVPDAVRK